MIDAAPWSARSQPPAHLVSPGNQTPRLFGQIVLVRLDAHPAQIQSIAVPAGLNGGAVVHLATAVVLYRVAQLVELLGLQVKKAPIQRS